LRQQLAVLKRSQTKLKIKQRAGRTNANTLLYQNPISRQYKRTERHLCAATGCKHLLHFLLQ
jgi:hypothetical protein